MQPARTIFAECRRDFRLPENALLRLSNAKGCRIACVSGRLLITAYRQAQDVELHPSGVFIVPTRGVTLVEGIGCSTVRVEWPDPALFLLHPWRALGRQARWRQALASLPERAARAWPVRLRH